MAGCITASSVASLSTSISISTSSSPCTQQSRLRWCYCPVKFPNFIFQFRKTSKARFEAKCLATTESRNVAGERMLVFVPPHPLIKHWISVLRNEQSPCPIFKSAMAELGRLLIYEASRDWLPIVSGEIQTPLGVASVEFIDPREPVTIVPVLRAGLVLVEHAASILPATKTYHVGYYRDENTLQPTLYLNKLPERFPEGSRVLVADPMLATGGTIVATIDLLKDRGIDPKEIRVVSAVAAPPALQKLSDKFPGLHVYTGTIDPSLDENGFIIPGLGDAGDRSYGT
jgi:uracil phosphoribosyltransferase